jgi:hypothetical protein
MSEGTRLLLFFLGLWAILLVLQVPSVIGTTTTGAALVVTGSLLVVRWWLRYRRGQVASPALVRERSRAAARSEPLVAIKFRRGRFVTISVASGAATLLLLVAYLASLRTGDTIGAILTPLCAIATTLAFVSSTRRLLSEEPALTLTSDALVLHFSPFKGRSIPRSDAHRARLFRSGPYLFLGIELINTDRWVSALNPVKKLRISLSPERVPISVPVVLLRGDHDWIADQITRWAASTPLGTAEVA